jgi:hypothetical protein
MELLHECPPAATMGPMAACAGETSTGQFVAIFVVVVVLVGAALGLWYWLTKRGDA